LRPLRRDVEHDMVIDTASTVRAFLATERLLSEFGGPIQASPGRKLVLTCAGATSIALCAAPRAYAMVAGYDTKVMVEGRETCPGMPVALLSHCSSTGRPVGSRCYAAELCSCRIEACGKLFASSSVSYKCIVSFEMVLVLLRPPEINELLEEWCREETAGCLDSSSVANLSTCM